MAKPLVSDELRFYLPHIQAHLRRLEEFIGNDVSRQCVTRTYPTGLNGPNSTAHAYLSFPLLLIPANEGS